MNALPGGTIVSNCEAKLGDRGSFARASGTSAVIIGHLDDGEKTRVKLPSGTRKTIVGGCRAMVGVLRMHKGIFVIKTMKVGPFCPLPLAAALNRHGLPRS